MWEGGRLNSQKNKLISSMKHRKKCITSRDSASIIICTYMHVQGSAHNGSKLCIHTQFVTTRRMPQLKLVSFVSEAETQFASVTTILCFFVRFPYNVTIVSFVFLVVLSTGAWLL